MRNGFSRYALLLLVLAGITACARLPEFAKPRAIQGEEMDWSGISGFTYRPLTRQDFRASSLPENLATRAEKINAQSAILIRPTSDSKLRITRLLLFDPVIYQGSINHLAFEAVMIPDKSWWNPKIEEARTEYVLEHEQIHFALTEIAARKLTRQARQWATDLLVKGQTPQQVYLEIVQKIKEKINEALEANRKRHLQFDEDTSLFYAPSWQNWWLRTVEEELKKSEVEQ